MNFYIADTTFALLYVKIINSNIIPSNYQFSNPQQTASAQDATVVPSAQGSTVSWQLLFDRTYDMVYSGNDPAANRGVLKDVAALYNIMGVFAGYGVPYMSPVKVIFGQLDTGQVWGYTGYLSAANIDYGIFRQNMIPSRCTIDRIRWSSCRSPPSPPWYSKRIVVKADRRFLTTVPVK